MTLRNGRATRLCPQAEAAVDALVESGWDLSRVPDEYRASAEALVESFGHACTQSPEAAPELVEATIRKLLSEPMSEASLSDASADALDMWSLSGYHTSSVPRSLRAQADRHEAFAAMISRSVADAEIDVSDSLIEDTLTRISEFEALAEPRSFGFPIKLRLADIATVAAVLIVGLSVTLPVLSTFRFESMRKLNESNFAVASVAFGSYANDNNGSLPVYTPSDQILRQSADTLRRWWMVGLDPLQSNSANLYTLAREGYTSLESLASPGNKNAIVEASSEDAVDWGGFNEVSYSFRVLQGTPEDDRWARRGVVTLTDRSPVILKAYQGLPIDPFENSPNHNGRGQHILNGDGSVDWLTSPWLAHNDQIFLPRFLERLVNPGVRRTGMMPLQGTERPTSFTDAFVGP